MNENHETDPGTTDPAQISQPNRSNRHKNNALNTSAVLNESTHPYLNQPDVSYVGRNEDSRLMKSTVMNQSLNMTNIDFEDLEDQPKQDQGKFDKILQNNDLESRPKPKSMKPKGNLNDISLDPMGYYDPKLAPIGTDTPNMANANNGSGISVKQNLKSQHIDHSALANNRLRKNQGVRDSQMSNSERNNTQGVSFRNQQEEEKIREAPAKLNKDPSVEQVIHLQNIPKEKKEEEEGNVKNVTPQANKKEAPGPQMKPSASGLLSQISSTAGEKTCKICLENTEDEASGKFVTPCKCTGSVRFIHDKCLKQWLESQQTQTELKKAKCELCHTRYNMKFVYKYKFNCKHAIGEGAVSLISGFCLFGMIIGLLALVISLLVSSDLSSSNNSANTSGSAGGNTSSSQTSSKNSANVKIFVSLVCGIFIVVLSLLLCFAWREAFFTKKICEWKIGNYKPGRRRRGGQVDPTNSLSDSQGFSGASGTLQRSDYSQSQSTIQAGNHTAPVRINERSSQGNQNNNSARGDRIISQRVAAQENGWIAARVNNDTEGSSRRETGRELGGIRTLENQTEAWVDESEDEEKEEEEDENNEERGRNRSPQMKALGSILKSQGRNTSQERARENYGRAFRTIEEEKSPVEDRNKTEKSPEVRRTTGGLAIAMRQSPQKIERDLRSKDRAERSKPQKVDMDGVGDGDWDSEDEEDMEKGPGRANTIGYDVKKRASLERRNAGNGTRGSSSWRNGAIG